MARILVVDDEPDVRELFNITLKMAGHVTDTAKDGLEAIDKLKGDIPDLVLLDLMMPNLDGFGLLSRLRQEMQNKPLRVLVATAKVLEESDQEKLEDWPVVGVLNKGELDIGQMVVIVSSALTKSPAKEESKAGEEAPSAKLPKEPEKVSSPEKPSFEKPPAEKPAAEKPAAEKKQVQVEADKAGQDGNKKEDAAAKE
ncbi:MAG: response regulator [Anaerolineae bacterium]|nr:response regulator [Anaerolineae bacterium]